ncbi:MAG TPA: diacylglycerol kinase family protein [Nocardioidaceae bacterium]|nr:diacylglycerol kinase family protein [Nocardioidaceae bacterium]
MDSLLLITNAEAGTSDDEALQSALAVLRSAADVEVARTSNPGELDGVLHRRGGRRIVVAGGDGSLHAVVAALHRRNELSSTTVALVPMGTGNDFARGSGIPLDTEEAARLAVTGEVYKVDLLVNCVGEVVVNAVHVGIGAEAGRAAHKWKSRLGKLGYAFGALIAGFNTGGLRLHVQADGEVVADFARPIIQVALGNGSHVGGGTELLPNARLADGRADLVISYATSPWAKLGYTVQLLRGLHQERDDVLALRAASIRISGQDFYCNADGEVYGPEIDHSWHVEPQVLQIVLPD